VIGSPLGGTLKTKNSIGKINILHNAWLKHEIFIMLDKTSINMVVNAS